MGVWHDALAEYAKEAEHKRQLERMSWLATTVDDEMVERAGRELWKVIFHRRGEDANQEWERNKPATCAYFKAQARRILEAALGGAQE